MMMQTKLGKISSDSFAEKIFSSNDMSHLWICPNSWDPTDVMRENPE